MTKPMIEFIENHSTLDTFNKAKYILAEACAVISGIGVHMDLWTLHLETTRRFHLVFPFPPETSGCVGGRFIH